MAGDIFVGREPELKALQQFLEKATAAKTQIVFVAGEAGAGKSALVTEFVRRAETADPTVVAAIGECNAQTGAGDAYLPFRQVLTVLSGAQDAQETGNAVNPTNAARLKELVRVSGETLLDVGPDLVGIFVPGAALFAKLATRAASNSKLASKLAERMGKSEKELAGPMPNPSLDQDKIFQQYAQVVQALSREHTLVLILDDLQWADAASLNLLFHLARQLKDSRVLLMGTYRPDDVALGRGGERHPLEQILNELKRYYGDIVIDLSAAQATEGRAFVDALVDVEPNRLDAAFRSGLFGRTEGHPLFTVELLRNLQERGDLVLNAEGSWVTSPTLNWEALPARVEGVIEERIARLEDNLHETLNIGSVVGFEFAAQVVARVQKIQERELLKNLTRELEKRHRLVLEQGETKVGNQFLSQFRFVHALFQQFLYNELGSGERRLIHGEVAEGLEQLYGEHTDDIVVELARHYQEAGNDEKGATYLIRAGDAAERAYAYTEARGLYSLALDTLKRLPDTTANRRRRVDVTLHCVTTSYWSDSPESNLARLDEIEPLVRDLPGDGTPGGDPLRRARVHYQRGQLLMIRNDMPKVVAEFEQVLPVALEFGDPELLILPSAVIGGLLVERGQFAQAQELLDPVLMPLEKAGNWDAWNQAACPLVVALSARGHLAEARELIDRALERGQALKSPHQLALAKAALGVHYVFGGEWQRAGEALNTARSLAAQSGDRFVHYGTLSWLYWAEAGLGDFGAAGETYAQWHTLDAQLGNISISAEQMKAVGAWIALLTGEIDNALSMAEQGVNLAQTTGVIFATGLAERVWGEALARCTPPRWEQADEHFAASLRACEEGDSRLDGARTHVAWGKVLASRGNEVAAREHYDKAAAQFQASELTSELKQTKELINSLSA